MKTVTTHEAKTHLSRLLKHVAKGQDVIILRGSEPVARLTAVKPARDVPVLGTDRGAFSVPDDFNDPLPDDVLAGFEGTGA